jgi:signal transduction histidine kinase
VTSPDSPEKVDRILRHLAEIGAGECSITDATIAKERDPELRQVLVGLLILHEDLEYERRRSERAEAEREVLLDERQRAIVARDHFLAAASHELKTPLTTLLLQTELFNSALRRMGGANLEGLEARLTVLKRQTVRIDAVVNEMLDVSRITMGHLALRPTELDLSKLARDTIRQLELDSVGPRVETVLAAAQPVVGSWDESRVAQVLSILLSNAYKYGNGRPVEVRVAPAGENALLEVEDHGIGISLDDQRRIFAPFSRAASVDHYGGLGLGLWICQQIVAASGGTIRVRSALGEGSTFSIELPGRRA